MAKKKSTKKKSVKSNMSANKKMCERKFPTFGVLLFIAGVMWLLEELKVIVIDIPWLPIVLIVVALGMIMNRVYK